MSNDVEREWLATFGAAPRELIWPGYRGKGTLEFKSQDDLKALQLNSSNIRLIKLGELESTGGSIGVRFEQTQWIGGFGLFFGHHFEVVEGEPCAAFQIIWLARTLELDGRHVLRLQRATRFVWPQTGSPQTQLLLGIQEVDPVGSRPEVSLEVAIKDHRVERVMWGGQPVPRLASEAADAALKPGDYEGAFGLYNEDGVLWCSDPAFERFSPGD